MEPRFLLLDADDTLFDFKRSERQALNELLRQYGLPVTPEILDKYAIINLHLWRALERGEVTRPQLLEDRFLRLIDYIRHESAWNVEWDLKDYDWDLLDGNRMNDDYLTHLGEQSFLLPDAEVVVSELCGRYTIAMITNGVERVQRSRLADSPIADCFSALFISEEVGFEKPDPRFFDHACEVLGIEDRREALVVGDSLSADILGGRNAGIRTCWFNPFGTELPESENPIVPDYTIQSLRELPTLLSIM